MLYNVHSMIYHDTNILDKLKIHIWDACPLLLGIQSVVGNLGFCPVSMEGRENLGLGMCESATCSEF